MTFMSFFVVFFFSGSVSKSHQQPQNLLSKKWKWKLSTKKECFWLSAEMTVSAELLFKDRLFCCYCRFENNILRTNTCLYIFFGDFINGLFLTPCTVHPYERAKPQALRKECSFYCPKVTTMCRVSHDLLSFSISRGFLAVIQVTT